VTVGIWPSGIDAPVIAPIWSMSMTAAIPVMYPIRMGRDNRLAKNPSRASEAIKQMRPTSPASTVASAW